MGTGTLLFSPVPGVEGAEVMLFPRHARAAGQPLAAEILELVLVSQRLEGGHTPGGEPSTTGWGVSASNPTEEHGGNVCPPRGQGQPAMLNGSKLQP